MSNNNIFRLILCLKTIKKCKNYEKSEKLFNMFRFLIVHLKKNDFTFKLQHKTTISSGIIVKAFR